MQISLFWASAGSGQRLRALHIRCTVDAVDQDGSIAPVLMRIRSTFANCRGGLNVAAD